MSKRGARTGLITYRVQHHWSSAYMGYGLHSLDRDAQEMEDLVKQLVATGMSMMIRQSHLSEASHCHITDSVVPQSLLITSAARPIRPSFPADSSTLLSSLQSTFDTTPNFG